MRAGARGRSTREIEAEHRRHLEREVERRVREQLSSGSRSGSRQQQEAGARGRPSREVEAEDERYLEREVERRVREHFQQEKDRWEQGTRQEQGARHTKEGKAPWSGRREGEESQRWRQSTSGSRKDGDRQQSPEYGRSGVPEEREREEEAHVRQYMGTAGGGVSMGLPKRDGREGPGGWQLGPPWGVHGQTAAGYGHWMGGLGPNMGPQGTQGGWVGSPSAQGCLLYTSDAADD